MGLFVTEDGHYQGWLAALLCCCAAVADDEHPIERAKDEAMPSKTVAVCNQQPALTLLPSTPMDIDAKAEVDAIGNQKDEFESHYQRPQSLKPLDLGASSLMPGRNTVDLENETRHVQRPSFSTPRQGLVPLRLGPVVLRDSPDAELLAEGPVATQSLDNRIDQRARSDSTQDLLGESKRESYRETRETPYQRCSRRSTDMLAMLPSTPPSESATQRPTISTQSSASSLRRQAIETRASSARPSAEASRPARLKRKQSDPLSRKAPVRPSEADLDQEILELNTIVEERRADAARSHAADAHIPAVAPLMKVRARSETLNDIGSAFSRPLTARETTRTDESLESGTRPARPATSRGISRSSNFVSGWLSSIITSSSPTQASHAQEPFYKCAATSGPVRPVSRSSLCSSLTALESPSLTLASSPTATSKGHSRSLTMESRLTSLEPVDRAYDAVNVIEKKAIGDTWRASSPSQVGLAI